MIITSVKKVFQGFSDRKIDARLSSRFWRFIEKRSCRIAILGDKAAVESLLSFADEEQQVAVSQIIAPERMEEALPQLKLRTGEEDAVGIDLLVIPDQKLKQQLSERARQLLQADIPVKLLFEDLLSGKIRLCLRNAINVTNAGDALPQQSYIVASSRRTGSTMLCSSLNQTGVAGHIEEYIELKTFTLAKQGRIQVGQMLVDALKVNQTPNGIFGLKVHFSDLERFRTELLPGLNAAEQSVFHDLVHQSRYIYLTRRNQIRQAISDWRANATSVHQVLRNDKESLRKLQRQQVPYQYDQLNTHLKGLVEDDRSWHKFFAKNQISPLTLVYEDMVRDPNATLRSVLDYLNLKCDRSDIIPVTEQLADEYTENIYNQFVADLTQEYGAEVIDELTGQAKPPAEATAPAAPPAAPSDVAPRKQKVLVSVATTSYLDMAKQFFASAHFNGGWDGDYLLLAHDIPEAELTWFRERGILIKHCPSLYPAPIGGMHPCMATKYYMFTPYFKQWEVVVYSDLDAIVRAPLEGLDKVKGFAAVDDWSPSLYEQVVNADDIAERGLDPETCKAEIAEVKRRYQLARRPFCAGFFVFSTDIIHDRMLQDLKEMTDRHQTISKFGDQLAMNFYFYDRWQKLTPTYNVLVRQKNYKDLFEHFVNVETRWGAVQDVSAYILHIFDPKPWDPSSGFHLEWLANLRKAEKMDLHAIPEVPDGKLEAVRETANQIRFRQQVYDFLEVLGPAKVWVIEVLHFVYWRLLTLKRIVGYFAGSLLKRGLSTQSS